jgi:hypothetical protein
MRRALARVCIAIDHTSEKGLALRLLELDRPFAILGTLWIHVAIDGVHQETFCRNGVLQVEVPASVPQNHLMVFSEPFHFLSGAVLPVVTAICASFCDGRKRPLSWSMAYAESGCAAVGLIDVCSDLAPTQLPSR